MIFQRALVIIGISALFMILSWPGFILGPFTDQFIYISPEWIDDSLFELLGKIYFSPYVYINGHPPLHTLVITFFLETFGWSFFVAQWASLVLVFFSIAFAYFVGKTLWDHNTAACLAAVFTVAPFVTPISTMVWAESFYWGLGLLFAGMVSKKRWGWVAFLGLIGILWRESFVALLVSTPLALAFLKDPGVKDKRLWLSLVPGATAVLSHFAILKHFKGEALGNPGAGGFFYELFIWNQTDLEMVQFYVEMFFECLGWGLPFCIAGLIMLITKFSKFTPPQKLFFMTLGFSLILYLLFFVNYPYELPRNSYPAMAWVLAMGTLALLHFLSPRQGTVVAFSLVVALSVSEKVNQRPLHVETDRIFMLREMGEYLAKSLPEGAVIWAPGGVYSALAEPFFGYVNRPLQARYIDEATTKEVLEKQGRGNYLILSNLSPDKFGFQKLLEGTAEFKKIKAWENNRFEGHLFQIPGD